MGTGGSCFKRVEVHGPSVPAHRLESHLTSFELSVHILKNESGRVIQLLQGSLSMSPGCDFLGELTSLLVTNSKMTAIRPGFSSSIQFAATRFSRRMPKVSGYWVEEGNGIAAGSSDACLSMDLHSGVRSQTRITVSLVRPNEGMRMGCPLPGCGGTCRAYPPQRPTVGTGPASESLSQ